MSSPQWSQEQEAAVAAIKSWYDNKETQVFKLFGAAGTGKTTLAKTVAETIGGNVFFAAYTGKAASVLQKKGCPGATTIHSLIYNPKDKGRVKLLQLERALSDYKASHPEAVDNDPELRRLRHLVEEERKSVARPFFELKEACMSELSTASLLVVDECSMVDDQLGQDVLSFDCPTLVLGDPYQLPPVAGTGFFTHRKVGKTSQPLDPDFMLTQIHRQAEGNPIIDLATRTRNKEVLEPGQYGDSLVVKRDGFEGLGEAVMAADQVLVGTNKSRRAYNRRIRELKGFSGDLPQDGEKLVCLRNNHELGLLNGTIWNVEQVEFVMSGCITMSITPEDGGDVLMVEAFIEPFLGQDVDYVDRKQKGYNEFDFGYALTTHKSQGSQWDNVLVLDEWTWGPDRYNWLYTAITRAAKTVTVVQTK